MQNEGALRYHRKRGIYFLAVIFAVTIGYINIDVKKIGHLNIKTKMLDIEARILIG